MYKACSTLVLQTAPLCREKDQMLRVCLIWIQPSNAPFIQCSTFAVRNPWVCAQWQCFCSVSHNNSSAANWAVLCLYTEKHTVCILSLVLPHFLVTVFVPRPLYCSVAAAFAASAAQSCWLQILPYMVIHSSLPDSLPRPFLPCPAIGCFMRCQYTCEFWDRPKY